MRSALASLLIATALVASCGDGDEPAAAAPDRVEGVIIAIDSDGLEDVNSFTLKDGDETYEIFIADDVDYGFPLGHLQEHVQSAGPVSVDLETRDDQLYALTIEDV
jgi:hypothetical protein